MLLDDTLALMSNKYRRRVLYTLRDTEDDTVPIDELIDSMVDEDYLHEEEKDSFEVQMHHQHLPYLVDNGIIEYDNSGHVRKVADDEVYDLLDFLEKFEEEPLIDDFTS